MTPSCSARPCVAPKRALIDRTHRGLFRSLSEIFLDQGIAHLLDHRLQFLGRVLAIAAMFILLAMRGHVPLDVGFDGDLPVGGAGHPQISDPAMPQAVERLVGSVMRTAGERNIVHVYFVAQPLARPV